MEIFMNDYNEEKFENEVRKIFKKKIEKPLKFEYTIKNFEYNENKNIKNIGKIATATVCLTIVMTTSIVGAFFAKTKIWKKPYIITEESKIKEEENVKKPITDEEKKNFINQETVLENANLIVTKMGYDNLKFENIELIRDYDNEIHYKVYKENKDTNDLEVLMNLNPYNCKLEYFCDYNAINKKKIFDEISENEAKEIAIKYYKDLEIYDEDDEIIEVKKQPVVVKDIEIDMWQVTFGKKINGMEIPDSKYSICFNVENHKPIVYIIKAKEKNDNNFGKVEITKDEAIKIATQKEKSFSNLDINEVSVELSIKKMNMFIYCLENNIDNKNGELKIDDNSRIVWVVEVKHNKNFKPREYDLKSIKELYNKKYYIDAETGEIVGGEQTEFFNNI